MKFRRILTAVCAAVLGCCAVTGCGNKNKEEKKSTEEIVREMGIGINLGNTFEACGDWISSSSVTNYETAWGSPVITQPMIKGYADAGFGVLRVPVAWSNMMQENYTVHPDYLKRVHEVVTWALEANLFVILNIHYDGGWWEDFADPAKKSECMTKYRRIWEQISAEFQEESVHLMFESLNEEGCWNTIWNRYGGSQDGKAEAYALLNEINQLFVDTVRKSGGCNEKRHLLIAGYATDVTLTCDEAFQMPKDSEKRCAVSVHYYTPATFCILEEDANWGKMQTEWGSEQDVAELKKNMDLVKTTFIDKGIPVIMGEYGTTKKERSEETVRLYLTSVCKEAYSRGICPVLWDTTGNFYDRQNAKMYDETLHQQLLAIVSPADEQKKAA